MRNGPSTNLETFTAGVETTVDVAGIERQLQSLWHQAADADGDSSRRAITRACLFNFVVFCESEEARDQATAAIATLTSSYPSRVLMLLAPPGPGPEKLSAAITAHCHWAGGGRKQVCCEQISLEAEGDGVARLPGIVLSLLESDLPTLLWWRGVFLDRPELFERMADVADRVLFDTSSWAEPVARLESLGRLLGAAHRWRATDLSWTRLGLWRQLTAEFFDEPQCRAELDRLSTVHIVHGHGPGADVRALLLGAWLAAQVNWDAATAAARIRLEAHEDTDATSVGLLQIELKSVNATFTVRKNLGEWTASTVVAMPSACSLPRKRAFRPSDDAALLAQELEQSSPSRIYLRALARAMALAGKTARG